MTILFDQFTSLAQSAQGTTNWVLVDPTKSNFQVTVACVLSNTPSLTYQFEYTTDPISSPTASVNAVAVTGATGLTASDARLIGAPVSAVRLNVTAYTSGTATLQVRQSGVPYLVSGE